MYLILSLLFLFSSNLVSEDLSATNLVMNVFNNSTKYDNNGNKILLLLKESFPMDFQSGVIHMSEDLDVIFLRTSLTLIVFQRIDRCNRANLIKNIAESKQNHTVFEDRYTKCSLIETLEFDQRIGYLRNSKKFNCTSKIPKSIFN